MNYLMNELVLNELLDELDELDDPPTIFLQKSQKMPIRSRPQVQTSGPPLTLTGPRGEVQEGVSD